MNSLRAVKKLLHFDRWIRRMKNRMTSSSEAHWIDDIASAIAYVDFLKTLLILNIAIFAPRHFFKNLPQYVVRQPPWFKTPIAFCTSSAALVGLLLIASKPAALENSISNETISGWQVLLAVAITMPVTMAFACFAYWLLLLLFYPVPSVRRLRDVRTRMLLPSSIALYRHMVWKRFVSSLLYFDIYAIYAGIISEIALLVILGVLLSWLSIGLFAIAFFVAAIFTNYFLIVQPYIVLLERSVFVPTERMLRAHCYEIFRLVSAVDRNWSKGRAKSAAKALSRLERLILCLELEAGRFDSSARIAGAEYMERLSTGWASTCSSALDVERMRNSLPSPGADELRASMSAIFDRVDDWRLHQVQVTSGSVLFHRDGRLA